MCSGSLQKAASGQKSDYPWADPVAVQRASWQAANAVGGNGRAAAVARTKAANKAVHKERERQYEAYAAAQQAEADRISAQRKELARKQQQQLAEMQQRQVQAIKDQQNQANALRGEQAKRLAALKADTAKQQAAIAAARDRDIGLARARGAAVSGSLRVLSQGPTQSGPSAQQSSRSQQTRGAKSTTASLRMGSGSRGRGSGANLSI